MPALMFAFDGFLMSSSLQSEAKDETTYKKALTIATVIYVVFELALVYGMFSYGAANAEALGGQKGGIDSGIFGVTGVLSYLFGDQAY